jgi:hypothetical protein
VGCPQLRVNRVNMLDHWLHAMLLLQMGRVSIVGVVWLTNHCQTKGFAAFQKNQALDQALDFGFPILKRLFQ